MTGLFTIKEIISHVPKCVICQKDMIISLSFVRYNYNYSHYPYINYLTYKNNFLFLKKDQTFLNFCIDVNNNIYIKNAAPTIYKLNKTCKTCRFDMEYIYNPCLNNKVVGKFSLREVNLIYYKKSNIRVYVCAINNFSTKIYENNAILATNCFDIQKLNNIKKINKFIDTVKIYG